MYDERPIGVTIITILLIIMGTVFLLQGFLGFSSGFFGLYLDVPDENLQLFANVLSLLLGMFFFGLSIAMYQLQRWAWIVTLLGAIFGVLMNIGILLSGSGQTLLLNLVLGIGIIIYLLQGSIRSAFTDAGVS